MRSGRRNNKFVCVASALCVGLEFVTNGFKVHTCESLIGCEPVSRDWNRNSCLVGGGAPLSDYCSC